MSTVVEIPTVASGPTARLALNDPSTQAAIASVLTAAGTVIWPSMGHSGLSEHMQQIVVAVCGGFATVVVALKHVLAGRLARTVIGDAEVAAKVAEAVDPALKPAIESAIVGATSAAQAVEATPAATPTIEPAVLDIARQLVGLIHPSAPAEPVSNVGA